jgi:hypothetical protein
MEEELMELSGKLRIEGPTRLLLLKKISMLFRIQPMLREHTEKSCT